MRNTKYLFDEDTMTPEGMVSVSQLQTYMSCPKKWEYNYVERLTPRVERPYLNIGRLCHKGMQEVMRWLWLHNEDDEEILIHAINLIKTTWLEYMNSNVFLEEEIPDLKQMCVDAIKVFEQAFQEFNPHRYEVVTLYKDGKPIPALELHFCVPCAGSKGLHGYIDAILRDRETGMTWCTDYKFRKSLSPDEEESINIQNAVYTYACTKMGIKITGTMTWQHLNTPAADPALLKNGTISRAKIKTTWKKYEEFCRANGVDPEPYRDEMQEKLADIEWFRATYEYRNPETINNIWKEAVVPASRAVKAAYAKAQKGANRRCLYPWNCKMCQYKDLCQAELRNHDADFLRKNEYVVKDVKKPLDTDGPRVV